ncbi:hypothetical protein JOF53_005943 [Crossiella equi]|uniref:Uncharacterized protein n=1 Tax=Crossiella equi TaxID=130796 RepID=A0ABS5AKH6_9PSEU|nr:hypothetical protein [Crossiella equi]MBP2477071.1 hypothetical protein [Crossiella equi]
MSGPLEAVAGVAKPVPGVERALRVVAVPPGRGAGPPAAALVAGSRSPRDRV